MTPAIFTTVGAAASACLSSRSQLARAAGETDDEPLFADVFGSFLVNARSPAKPAPTAASGVATGSVESWGGALGFIRADGTTIDTSAADASGTTAVAVENPKATQADARSCTLLSINPLATVAPDSKLVGSGKPLQSEGTAQGLAGVEVLEEGSDEELAQPTVSGRHRRGSRQIGKHSGQADAEVSENTCLQSPNNNGDAKTDPTSSGIGALTGPGAVAALGSLQIPAPIGNPIVTGDRIPFREDSAKRLASAPNDVHEPALPDATPGRLQPEHQAPAGNDELNQDSVGRESIPDSTDVNHLDGVHETVLPDVTPGYEQSRLDAESGSVQPQTPQSVSDDEINFNTPTLRSIPKPEADPDRMLSLSDFQRAGAPLQHSIQMSQSPHSDLARPDSPSANAAPVRQDPTVGANKRAGRTKGTAVIETPKPLIGEAEEVTSSGMGDAATGCAMKALNELHTIAGSDENILPGGEDSGFSRQNDREPFGIKIGEKLSHSVLDTLFVAHEAGPNHQQMSQAVAGTSDSAVSAAESTQISVEKLTHQVMDRVATFKSLYQDHMAVMVKPDDHTEIRLQFTLKADGVDVSARVEHGDFNTLRANWGQLQQTLADQGIHMGELDRSLSNANNLSQFGSGANMGSAQEQAPRHRSRLDEDLAEELAGAGAMAEPLHVRLHNSPRVTPRRWERWA